MLLSVLMKGGEIMRFALCQILWTHSSAQDNQIVPQRLNESLLFIFSNGGFLSDSL